ncbi:MAG: hypothetical protein KGM93_12670, partial [Sphingomonadales bacterium]|nr:hypothetical protein [Sphingomonadales bacterium]
MSEEQQARDIGEARGLRNEAWSLVQRDIAQVRRGLDGRLIAGRLKDRATREVVEAIDQAREVASEHKAIVAGTFLALVGWFLREPIGTALVRLLRLDGEGGDEIETA